MRRKIDNEEKVRVTIWMPQKLKTALLGKAKSCGMPASTIVEKLLEKYLDNVTFEVEVKEIQAVEKGTAGLGETLGGEESSSKSTRRQA